LIIKNGTYNGKELCEMFEIDNNKFKNNVDTYLNKISQYCTIELIGGNGKGRKYVITNSNEEEINIDFSTRLDKEKKRKNRNSIYDNKNNKEFYVYVHYINDEVVYIGKGKNYRATDKNREYDIKMITKIEILKWFDDEEKALEFEEETIKHFQSIGQCKFNNKIYKKGFICNKSKEKEEENFNKKINKDFEKMFKYMI
jgi:hypothetical protein